MDTLSSEILGRVAETWRRALADLPEARKWLGERGIPLELAERFRIGWSAGSLASMAGGGVLERLRILGLVDAEGRERFTGRVVIPAFDEAGSVVQVAAYDPEGALSWLFTAETPVFWNAPCLKHAPRATLVPHPLAGLLEIAGGKAAVIAPAGPGVPLGPGARDALLAHAPHLVLRDCDHLRSELEKLGIAIEGTATRSGATVVVQDRDGFAVDFPRRLRVSVQGLRQDSPRHLRASVKLFRKPSPESARSERPRLHLDTFDLYHARSRIGFARTAACLLGEDPTLLEEHLARIVTLAEEFLAAREESPPAQVIAAEERDEALELLRDPRFPERVASDLSRLGHVGEESNKLVAYLASLSRKLEDPLSIFVASRSAAGKSTLAESVTALAPPEDVLRFTRLTAQTLYYHKPDALSHKLVLVEEAEGARDASYALRILQSARRLSLSSTTGKGQAKVCEVKGPVSLFVTSTELDEETASRFIVLPIDESREQTRAILAAQREAEAALPGDREMLLKLHRNAQRLLSPLRIVNPYAPRLTFPDSRLSARRDHRKYLGLIRAVAFSRQHQRKAEEGTLSVTLEDIALANRLAHHALGHSLYDLAPPARRLLVELREWLSERAAREKTLVEEIEWNARDLREHTGWKRTQLASHLGELVDSEYVLPLTPRGQGRRGTYRLDWDGRGMDGERFHSGLIDVATLARDYPDPFRTQSGTQEPAWKVGRKHRNGVSSGAFRVPGEDGSR